MCDPGKHAIGDRGTPGLLVPGTVFAIRCFSQRSTLTAKSDRPQAAKCRYARTPTDVHTCMPTGTCTAGQHRARFRPIHTAASTCTQASTSVLCACAHVLVQRVDQPVQQDCGGQDDGGHSKRVHQALHVGGRVAGDVIHWQQMLCVQFDEEREWMVECQ